MSICDISCLWNRRFRILTYYRRQLCGLVFWFNPPVCAFIRLDRLKKSLETVLMSAFSPVFNIGERLDNRLVCSQPYSLLSSVLPLQLQELNRELSLSGWACLAELAALLSPPCRLSLRLTGLRWQTDKHWMNNLLFQNIWLHPARGTSASLSALHCPATTLCLIAPWL